MKLIKFLQRNSSKVGKTSDFSSFLIHKSEKKKVRVFTEAAKRANEDQRKLFNDPTSREQTTCV